MFQFPIAPDTLVTRQIECVSCKEIFTIAEDYARATNSRSDYWRMPAGEPAHTESHELSEPTRQHVNPLPRAIAHANPSPILTWERSQRAVVNCPRCGTDNRNWLRIAYAPHPGTRWEKLRNYFTQFSLIGISVALTIFLIIRLLFREPDKNNLFAYALMIVIMILGTLVPIVSITGQWRKLRLHTIISQFDKTLPFWDRISPALRQGVFYFALFVFAVPTVIYVLLPLATSFFQDEKTVVDRIDQVLIDLNPASIQALQMEANNQLVPTENALNSMQSMMNKNLFLCNPTAVTTLLNNLNSVNLQSVPLETAVQIENATANLEELQTQTQNGVCDYNTVTKTLSSLSVLYQDNWQKCITAPAAEIAQDPTCNNPAVTSMVYQLESVESLGTPLFLGTLANEIKLTLEEARILVQETNDPAIIARIDNELAVIEKAISRANNGPAKTPGRSALITAWLKYVGLSCLAAVITAVVSTYIYVGQINAHLPKPLCYSLPHLTQVVKWEISRSFESFADLQNIKWIGAQRNPQGGITLEGLNRDQNETETGNYVRAQKYTIISDIWGNLMETAVKHVRVPKSISQQGDSIDQTIQQLLQVETNRETSRTYRTNLDGVSRR